MYILIVSRGTPSEKYKMNGLFELDQAKALAKAGHKVVMAALDARSIRRTRKWGYHKEERDGVLIRQLDVPLGALPLNLFYKLSGTALQWLYRRILKEFGKPDIIHAHFTDIAYITSELKERDGIPLVITEHSSKMNRNQESIQPELRMAAEKAYRKATALIAVSPALADKIKINFGIDSIYIPNIVDTKTFYFAPQKTKTGFDFISVGSLNDIKRMDLTIQAFAKAFGNREGYRLTIFGGGPNREKLENLIQQLGLSKQVKLMGLCHREQIAEHLRQSDAFVLASRSETFGVVYSEALCCGVPVIATRCGGPEGYINAQNGILVPVEDQDALVAAMQTMAQTAQDYNRKAIADSISAQFSEQAVVHSLEGLYQHMRTEKEDVLQLIQ